MKKWLVRLLGALTLVFLSLAGVVLYTFSGTLPLRDRMELSGDALQIKDGIVSVGMIPSGPGQVILIDCGNDHSSTTVLAELKRRGLGKEAVKAVFLTHGHGDHVGGCGAFADSDIFAMASEEAFLEGKVGSEIPDRSPNWKEKCGYSRKALLTGWRIYPSREPNHFVVLDPRTHGWKCRLFSRGNPLSRRQR